jgi:class 3 adenylate cyclase/tetratricopeptide (TPR) repeat protein
MTGDHGLESYLCALHRSWLGQVPDQRWRAEPGTLVFFDVSGFTPLTERLAAHGKVGAEELTDVLRTVFGALLAAAETQGGDTLKFGGDAVLILFAGDGHERRACSAAWAMQTVMRRFRRLRTSAGVVTLRASCGIASGPVHAFLVGRVFRELVIAGPTTSAALTMEKEAEAGQILLAPSTQNMLEAVSLGEPIAGGRLLAARPESGTAPGPSAVLGDPRLGLPLALIPYLQHTADGEHRHGVVAFVQFRGLDELLFTDGPTAAAAALEAFMTTVQRSCEDHRITFLGTDCDRRAGKVFLTTGSPVSADDDEDRMLLGLRAILNVSGRLTLRAGVNRGRVFAVHMGAPQRRSYATMGKVTNLAARVMGKAPDGGLLATSAVLDRAWAPFACEPVEPFRVKGSSELISGALVGDLDAAPRSHRAFDAHLVGREPELAVLCELLDAAVAGAGGAVELIGEPGIGKSRLLEAVTAVARSRRCTIIAIDAQAYEANTPYGAVRAPLRELAVGRGADDLAVRAALAEVAGEEGRPWLSLVGIPFGLDLEKERAIKTLDQEAMRARLHLEVARAVSAMSVPGTLLTVDNAHLLDEASGELLVSLIDRIGHSMAAVLSRRTDGRGPQLHGARSLTLGPLAADAVEELVHPSNYEHRPLPPAIATAISDRAHGNPLFLLELVAAAREGSAVDALPDSVEALLASRIDVLGPADRTLLREAAVLGTSFDRGLLADLAGIDHADLADQLARLDGFILADELDTLRFRHSLARDAAYEALPYRTRRRLHGLAGRLIEAGAGADTASAAPLLSLHADAAGDHARSWRFSALAATQARRRGAPVEAVTFLQRALRAGRQLADVDESLLADVGLDLGDAAELAGLYEQADNAYCEARRRVAGDVARTAELCRRQGWLRERTGSYSQALRWYSRAARAAQEAGDTPGIERMKGRIALAYGAARLRQGDLVGSLRHLDRAAAAAELLDDRPTLAHASYLLDWAHTDLGHPVALYRERALRIYEELEDWTGLANVLNNLGVNAFFAGDWRRALELYERSRKARERGGDVVRAGEALVNVGELLVDQGRLDEAEPPLRKALALWRGAGFPVGIGVALMNLGRIAARRGNDEQAGELIARARAQLDEIGSHQAIDAAVREGERHVLAGRGEHALGVLNRARTLTVRGGSAPVLLAQIDRLRGYALAQTGDAEAAMLALQASLEAAAGTPYEEALTSQAFARVATAAGEHVNPEMTQRADQTLRELGVRQTWPGALTTMAPMAA